MKRDRTHQGTTLMTAICAFLAVLLVIQLWLVSAALEALLSNDREVPIPAALASLVLFAVSGGLLLHAARFDSGLRKSATSVEPALLKVTPKPPVPRAHTVPPAQKGHSREEVRAGAA